MSIISMAFVCFQLFIAAFRVRKYLDDGEGFAVVTSIIFLAAQLILIYSLHSSGSTLKKMNEGKPPVISSREQSTRVWV